MVIELDRVPDLIEARVERCDAGVCIRGGENRKFAVCDAKGPRLEKMTALYA